MQEQLMVILTTTLSLLTAWSWNSVLQQYVDQYYGRSLSTRVLAAVIVTVITFVLINWLLNHFKLHRKKINHAKNANLTNYTVKASKPDSDPQFLAISPVI